MKKFLSVLAAGLITAASFATVASAATPEGLVPLTGTAGFNNEGFENLFDRNEQSKFCGNPDADLGYFYYVWEMPSAVEITGYQLVTANDTAGSPDRNPIDWVLYGCNDYAVDTNTGSWEEIHVVTGDTTLGAANYEPYTFTLDAKASSFKYFMFQVNATQGGGLLQLSEINLLFDGNGELTKKTDEELTALQDELNAARAAAEYQALLDSGYVPGATLNPVEGINVISASEANSDTDVAANLFDYNPATKYVTVSTPNEVIWEMPSAVAITGYQIVTPADAKNNASKNPNTWVLSGSNDGLSWTEIHNVQFDEVLSSYSGNNLSYDYMLDAPAAAYKYFKLSVSETMDLVDNMQIADFSLIYDGAVVETAAPETEAPVAETEAPVAETEAPVAETEAPVEETEAAVEETEAAVEETVNAANDAEETEAPKTFDAAIIAGVAAVVSLAGYAISKKH